MRRFYAVLGREFASYFATPLAYVFLILFLLAAMVLTFYLGNYFANGQADLAIFFNFHPWLYLFFLSAITMRLWSDEWRAGSIELLLTLPLPLYVIVMGKFFAAWGFAAIGLLLTVPIWMSVNYLGAPDNGVILASYLGSLMMAGGYLAIGTACSALTRSPIIAFVVTLTVAFLLTIAGVPLVLEAVQGFLPEALVDTLASFSFLVHFRAITAGVIDMRDIIFFASLIAICLVATGIFIANKQGAGARPFYDRLRMSIALILLLVIFIALNLAANIGLRQARIDLTQNRLFTLSTGSANILAGLDEPIKLRFYYSRRLAANAPPIRLYGQRVRDMLEEIETHADGKIDLEIIDPPVFSQAEDQAVAQGLTAQPLGDGAILYFGLVGSNFAGQLEVIPWFGTAREQYLEYDIVRMIYNLNTPEKPSLGIISNLPLDTGSGGLMAALDGQSQPFVIYQELVDRFDVSFINAQKPTIPDKIRVLLLAHPRPLEDKMLYAIDQFVMRGGRVIAFIDPHSEVSLTAGPNGTPLPGHTVDSSLGKLLTAWGVSMNPSQIIAERARAQRVAVGHNVRHQLADYILWMALSRDEMNQDDLVTANIDHLNIGTVGALTPHPDASLDFTPLVTSSKDASLYPRDYILTHPTPDDLLARFKPDAHAPHVIAARLQGQTRSAFTDALPEEASKADHKTQTKDANIIIFADSDFFDDRFWVSEEVYLGQRFGVPIADNAKFLLNAVDNLMGSAELISLRGRERIARPFTRIETLRRAAESRYRTRALQLRADVDAAQTALDKITNEGGRLTSQAAQNYRGELRRARRALRDVEADLRYDIERLTNRILWINILTAPALILLFAGGMVFYRARRSQTYRQNA